MSICKICGKEFDGENIYCTSCRWHMKWPDEILNAPEVEERYERSRVVKILSLDKKNATAEVKAAHAKQNYITTLGSCTCKDFALNHAEIPCKHILRLAEELGEFNPRNRHKYTLENLPPQRKILPEILRFEDDAIVEKYIEILRFIFQGRKIQIKNLKKRLSELDNDVLLSENDLKFHQRIKENFLNYIELRNGARRIKNYKRVNEPDELLEVLQNLGLIAISDSDVFSSVILSEDITFSNIEEILNIYGEFLPLFSERISKNPYETLRNIKLTRKRSEEILRPADATDTPEWAFRVPRYFNDSLDIRLTSRKKNSVEYSAWTQGINFSFDRGYMLYRDHESYLKGDPAIQVISAKKAFGTIPEKLNLGIDTGERYDEYYGYEENMNYYPGEVIYRDFERGEVKTKTQFDFVLMLIGIS